jgi:hypothetical protein
MRQRATVIESEFCPHHHPILHSLSYREWHEEAERRSKRGMKQRQCPDCKHWMWRDEFGAGWNQAAVESEGEAK